MRPEPVRDLEPGRDDGPEATPGEHPASARDPQRRLAVAPDPLPVEEGEALPHPDDDDGAEPHRGGTVPRVLRRWAAQRVARLDVVHQTPPTLQEVWVYLRDTPQVPESPLARIGECAWSAVALPSITVCYCVAWALERPLRALASAAVVTAVCWGAGQWAPTRWLLTILLSPLHLLGTGVEAVTYW